MTSKYYKETVDFARKYGFKLRKIKEGHIKIVRPNGSFIVVTDTASAKMQLLSEIFGKQSNDKSIFDYI
jgi:hypothetical protein